MRPITVALKIGHSIVGNIVQAEFQVMQGRPVRALSDA